MIVNTPIELKEAIKLFKDSDILAVDVETSRIVDSRMWKLDLYGIGIHDGKNGVYIPNHQEVYPLDIKELQVLFKDKKIVFHNAKFDLMVMEGKGFDFKECEVHDTKIMAYLVDENSSNRLKDLAESTLDVKGATRYDDVAYDFNSEQPSLFREEEILEAIDKMGEYCIKDVEYTMKFYHLFKEDLQKQSIWKLYNDLEKELVLIMKDMTVRGICVNEKYLQHLDCKLGIEIVELEGKICKNFGKIVGKINLGSPEQVAKVFFEEYKLPIGERSEKTNKWLLGEDKLLEIKNYYYYMTYNNDEVTPEDEKTYKICSESAELLLKFRKYKKLKSTYTSGLLKQSHNGVVHASFNETGTKTGRWSSSSPNLQNLPTDTEYDIRKAFISREDYKFIISDFSQIELRILAHCSNDENMINVYNSNGDIHEQTMNKINSNRKAAKTVNFGVSYGMSPYALRDQINKQKELGEELLTKKEAQEFIDRYFQAYPKVQTLIRNVKLLAKKQGFVRSMTKRKRRLQKWIYSQDKGIQAHAERQAFNFIIQSAAADILKIAIRNINGKIKDKFDAHLLVQVHDELIYEVKEDEVEEVKKIIKEEMEKAGEHLRVPLITEPEVSDHWKK